ncbi:MAG: N-acetylmuramoyl-L-alanine amidase [Firmicutes bacterium]|nr:N-acetylmuramoyl-L-alanine amidase [Bacillota bacterium]
MGRVTVIETDLNFARPLSYRGETDYLIVHHEASAGDVGAERVHRQHLNLGWAGIGYHYVIRFDGTIERGRPRDAIGSHAQGLNYCSVGISLSGNCQDNEPTAEQIEVLPKLLADLKDNWPDAQIIGHREVAEIVSDPGLATDCPGDKLYERLPDIIEQVSASE